jgi:hypothetical protein
MRVKWIPVAVAVLVTALLVAGCGAPKEFPTGAYGLTSLRGGEHQVHYDPDGTWRLIKGENVVSSGTYSLDGGRFMFETDSWCGETEKTEESGVYTWSVKSDALILDVVDSDPCTGRSSTFGGKEQTRVPRR